MKKAKIYSIEEAENLKINEVHDLYSNFINPNQTKIFSALPFGNELFNKAEGPFIYTHSGKKILDFTGGLGVLGLGHNHPEILKARIKFQEEKKLEVHKIIFSKYMAALASSISSLLPENLKKSFFLNSGAEAVEAAIKVCYKSFDSTKKYILFSNKSYHGKLIGSGSISGSYENNKFPKMENCLSFNFNDLNDLEEKISLANKKGGVYAVIIEPFSASLLEGVSEEFINKLFSLKKEYKFKVIFDEVFTGFYKCEKMFYFQNFKDISPDILCLSKTLGGGKSSISCLVIDDKTYNQSYGEISDTFLHTTTYNGFGEESITALAALNVLVKPEFKIRVSELSEKINSKLSFLQSKYPEKIEKVKGTGILNGIVFKSYIKSIGDLTEKIPIRFVKNRSYFLKKITATAISCELFKRFDILTSINDSANSNHLSISPSLILKDNELNYFFDSLEKVINENLDLESIKLIFQFIKK